MADINTHISVTGDSNGAKEALDGTGEAAGRVREHFDSLKESLAEGGKEFAKTITVAELAKEGLEKLYETLKEVVTESVSLWEKQEQADRNLSLMAGNLTESLKKQAEEFETLYGVSAEVTERNQTLALTFGANKDQVAELTEATTKWALITGHDASSAVETLVRSVEAGRHKAMELGIEWTTTGDKAKDLENAIAALNNKLAGADPLADATLEGRTNKAKNAFENLEKAFGKWMERVEQKGGVLDKLSGVLDKIRENASASSMGGILAAISYGPLAAGAGYLIGGLGEDTGGAATGEGEAASGGEDLSLSFGAPEGFSSKPKTTADELAKIQQANLAKFKAEQKFGEDMAKQKQKEIEDALKQEQEAQQKMLEAQLDGENAEVEAERQRLEKMQKMRDAAMKKQMEADRRAHEKLIAEWKRAGEQMATALANAIDTVLTNALKGQETKWQEIIGPLVQSAIGAVGMVVSAYNPAIGGVIQAAAPLANTAIQQIKHEGGWVERYHSGGWPGTLGPNEEPIVAEKGEYVVSRRQVAAMGGPAGVHAAMGGGGGMNFTIVAQDANDIRNFFEGRGGRGFVNAIRTRRGMLAPLLAAGLK